MKNEMREITVEYLGGLVFINQPRRSLCDDGSIFFGVEQIDVMVDWLLKAKAAHLVGHDFDDDPVVVSHDGGVGSCGQVTDNHLTRLARTEPLAAPITAEDLTDFAHLYLDELERMLREEWYEQVDDSALSEARRQSIANLIGGHFFLLSAVASQWSGCEPNPSHLPNNVAERSKVQAAQEEFRARGAESRKRSLIEIEEANALATGPRLFRSAEAGISDSYQFDPIECDGCGRMHKIMPNDCLCSRCGSQLAEKPRVKRRDSGVFDPTANNPSAKNCDRP